MYFIHEHNAKGFLGEKENSIDVLFLETNAFYREFTLDQMLSHTLEEQFRFLRYHDRWKDLTPEDFGDEPEFSHRVEAKGYRYFDKAVEADTAGYMTVTDEAKTVPMLNALYVRLNGKLCAQRGVNLVFVSTPSPTNLNYDYHNRVALLTEELGVAYLDMNVMTDQIPVDWKQDSYDGGDHLNYYGACKVTDYIGEFVVTMDGLTDKREHPHYEIWQEDLKQFHKTVEK